MHTIHLTSDQVLAYLRDLEKTIRGFRKRPPQVWVTVGGSGSLLGKRLAELAPDLYKKTSELIVAYDRTTDTVTFPKENHPGQIIKGKSLLLIDGTVHSGATLLRIAREVEHYNPSAISSYALAVRRGARMIPNHFGFMIGDHDRVHLPSPVFYNNRLFPFGIYRKISEADGGRPMIKTGADFIDKVNWEDRWYEVVTDPKRHVYVHEQGGLVVGFISFRYSDYDGIIVDEVGVDKKSRGQNLGGHLMRWAEHCGRHTNCSYIELWAVEDRVAWYRDMSFETVSNRPIKLAGRSFHKMRKKMLYNIPGDDNVMMGT